MLQDMGATIPKWQHVDVQYRIGDTFFKYR